MKQYLFLTRFTMRTHVYKIVSVSFLGMGLLLTAGCRRPAPVTSTFDIVQPTPAQPADTLPATTDTSASITTDQDIADALQRLQAPAATNSGATIDNSDIDHL